MAASNKANKYIEGGERHIRFNIDSSGEGKNEKKPQKYPTTQSALVNLQTKNIPAGSTIKTELKKCRDQQATKTKTIGNLLQPSALPESAEPIYGAPEMHSTLRVGHALIKAKSKKPDLKKLVEDKLLSPNTGSRVKKKTSKSVNVVASKKVFGDLVSVDISEEALAEQLEEQLQVRAAVVQPTPLVHDEEPKLEDYFNAEDYVTRARVTTAKVSIPFSCVRPQTVKREEYLKLCDHFLGSSYK